MVPSGWSAGVRGAQGVTDNPLVCFFLWLKALQALRCSLGVCGLPLRLCVRGLAKQTLWIPAFTCKTLFFFAQAFEAL